MAVYIELSPVEGRKSTASRTPDGRRSRAGIPNVRRPLRGIEVKSNTYAYFRVVQADGTPLKLVDSSNSDGESYSYANFLLQAVQDARMERQQILETFGAPYVFFFGESPRFIDVTATLIDTQDFNWHAEWWENYERYLRATRLAERGSTALLHYDDNIIEGYPVQASSVRSSDNPNVVQLQFKMFVTHYANVSDVGNPNFPLRQEAVLPDALNARDDRTFAFATDPEEATRRLVFAQTQALGLRALRQQIRNAQSIERVRELSRLQALKSLGVETDGVNLLTLGKGLFQGVVANIRGDNEGLQEASRRVAEEAKKALQLSMDGQTEEALQLLGLKKAPSDAVDAAQARIRRNLVQMLQSSLRYQASSPLADLNAFLDRLTRETYESNTRQLREWKRETPLRTKFADNYDEFTQTGEDESFLANTYSTWMPWLTDGGVPNVPGTVTDDLLSSGAVPKPGDLYRMGLGSSPLNRSFGAPSQNEPGRYSYSKRWGTSPQANGSHGGNLGGALGPGTGGFSQSPDQWQIPGTGLLQGDPFGNPNLPPYAFTKGLGPDGQELYKKEFHAGPKEDASHFGGGVIVKKYQGQDPGGQGSFTVLVLEGKLQ
jgi:hypothetical protein